MNGALRRWRSTGADLPFGDPLPSHGRGMEGWFWRFTDAATGRAAIALCGVNRHRDGDWATVAVATDPGGFVASAAVDGARASCDRFELEVGDVLRADRAGVEVRLPGVHLRARIVESKPWPRQALHGGGVASVLPFLGQYWHPFELGGRAEVEVDGGGDRWTSAVASTYAERNWGDGFPDRWWWGECHDLQGVDACVAFGGGRLTAGPAGIDITGVVVRCGDRVVRFAPPLARVRADVGNGRWRIEARRGSASLRIDGDVAGLPPHVLPVPIPPERRNVDTDLEALRGHVHVRFEEGDRIVFDADSDLAGLEVGALDPAWARARWGAAATFEDAA